MRATVAITALVLSALASGAPVQAASEPRVWNFGAYLDDKPIGYHRFTLREEGDSRELRSESRFEVKLLFVTAYRYSHDATEQWRGNCLEGMTARTDDNGERPAVDAKMQNGQLAVVKDGGNSSLPGCVMSFAYWNPQMLRQSRLLNAQTGEFEAVKISALGEDHIVVRGATVAAKRYRITGPKNPIDLWYSPGDEWLALESTVAGGRKLRYRLN